MIETNTFPLLLRLHYELGIINSFVIYYLSEKNTRALQKIDIDTKFQGCPATDPPFPNFYYYKTFPNLSEFNLIWPDKF